MPNAQAFEKYLENHPDAVDIWLGGHTHTHPDDTYGGKSHIEKKWNTNFINAAAVTKYHVGNAPMSRVLTFKKGSDEVLVKCYMHNNDYVPQGWYDKAERMLKLSQPFL